MNSSGESVAREQWPSIEFEKEAHRLAREDERGKLLSQCQREIVHEQGFDETGGPTCQCGELAHPLILIHAATRAMELYAAREREVQELVKAARNAVDILNDAGHPASRLIAALAPFAAKGETE